MHLQKVENAMGTVMKKSNLRVVTRKMLIANIISAGSIRSENGPVLQCQSLLL